MVGIVTLGKEKSEYRSNFVMQGMVNINFPEYFVFPITQEEIAKNDWEAIDTKIKEMLKKETSNLFDSLVLRYNV